MITKEEYLKAKAIVDEYERDEFDRNTRQAEEELDEMEPLHSSCEFCGCKYDDHGVLCPNNDSPFAQLVNEGYD